MMQPKVNAESGLHIAMTAFVIHILNLHRSKSNNQFHSYIEPFFPFVYFLRTFAPQFSISPSHSYITFKKTGTSIHEPLHLFTFSFNNHFHLFLKNKN